MHTAVNDCELNASAWVQQQLGYLTAM